VVGSNILLLLFLLTLIMNNLDGWRRLSYENNEAGMAISHPPRQQSRHVAKLHQTVEQNEESLT